MNDLDRQRSLNMLYAAPRTLRHQLETVETMTSVRIRDTIFQCVSEAESDTDEVQQQALQTLASVTKVSPQNRNLVAQTDGAISTLINLSKSSSPNVQFLSLSILFNLSLNPNVKQSLADMETISHLNSMILSSASLELSKLATSLICSLAMLDKNKAKFGVAGTIETLVEAVSGPRCPASHYLLSSLAELVQFHGNCTLAVRSGAVEVLLQIVENCEGGDLAGTSLAILCLLARFEEGLTALRKKAPQVVSSMLEVLQGRCSFSKEGAAEILIRLFDESDECVRDALSLPEFTSVLADLSVRGSARAREKAVLLMKKMIQVDHDSHGDGNTLLLQW